MTSRRLALTGLLSKHVAPALEPLGFQYARAERSFVRTADGGNWLALSFDPYRGREGKYFVEAGVQSQAVVDWFSRFNLINATDTTAWSALCRERLTPTGFGEHTWAVDDSDVALGPLLRALTEVAVPRLEPLLADSEFLAFLEGGENVERWVVPAWIALARGVLRRHLHAGADLEDLREEARDLEENDRMPEGLRGPYALLLGADSPPVAVSPQERSRQPIGYRTVTGLTNRPPDLDGCGQSASPL